jgi:hypothetical protein
MTLDTNSKAFTLKSKLPNPKIELEQSTSTANGKCCSMKEELIRAYPVCLIHDGKNALPVFDVCFLTTTQTKEER